MNMTVRLIKLYSLLLTIIMMAAKVNAQNVTPVGYTSISTSGASYVRVWNAVAPDTNSKNFGIRTDITRATMTTTYFDALGKPLQTVNKQSSLATGSPSTDVVTAFTHDAFGRQLYSYSPFASKPTGGLIATSDGSFKINPFQQDSAFKKSQFPDENWFYSQTNLETSSLSRPMETFAPGNSWSGTSGQSSEANRRSIKTKYWYNRFADSVRIWQVTDVAGNFGTYATTSGNPGIYAAGSLYKTVTVDENGKQIIEFKDKKGKVILKKVQLTAADDTGTGRGHSGWLCTYYIYDNLDNLRCVIQPLGVDLIQPGWGLTNATVLYDQCFRYEYDYYGRMISKKVPGAGSVLMVYDAKDRLIMTQDSTMRTVAQKQWMYTKYDTLNRPIITGLITDATNYNNVAYHRLRADTSLNYPDLTEFTNNELTRTFYDNYDWLALNGNPFSDNRSIEHDNHLIPASNTVYPYPQPLTQSFNVKGLVTGIKTKVLGTSQYLFGINYYDDQGRVIQTQNYNITGVASTLQTQYTYSGKVLKQVFGSPKNLSTPRNDYVISEFEYDDLGRLSNTKKTVFSYFNSTWVGWAQTDIARNEYDALGQLKKKKLSAGLNAGAGLENLNYDYNIRGWMLGANRAYAKDTTSTSNYFGFDLGYDKTAITINSLSKNYAAAQYNGNIGGMLWKSTGDDQVRKYDFSYDPVNRLTNADFTQFTNTNFSKAAGIDFSVKNMSYDANGNILTMNQLGWKLGGSQTIDSLLYTYTPSTNKLLNVVDRKNDTATKLGDFRSSKAYMTALSNNKTTAAADYTYDGNGNLTIDKNKDITAIRYNHLNLPDSIVVAGKGTIKYQYDAAGNKLKKTTIEGAKTTVTLYIDGAVYRNDTLEFIGHEEGRIRWKPQNNTFNFDYFLKDHLGNVRMVLTEEQQSDAYPAASMETAQATTEQSFYTNLPQSSSPKPSGYPNDTYTNPNDKVAKLRGDAQKIGPGIMLKVMAGDKFNLRVSSWYKLNGVTPAAPYNPIGDLVYMLAWSAPGAGSKSTMQELQNSGVLTPGATSFVNTQNGYITTRPKAFVNWVLLDEQFNFVSSSSGSEQVPAETAFGTVPNQIVYPHLRNGLPIDKSGYLYVYVSNETPNVDVFFDNLQVTHVRGPMLEETHYYPFGLTMAGISSKALNNAPRNKKGFNGNEIQNKEFNDGGGLEWYDFNARTYDPQIGRFIQVDPLSDTVDQRSLGPFQFSYNNPVRYNDPSGKCPCLFLIPLAKAAVAAVGAYILKEAAQPLIDEVVKAVEDRRLDGKDNSNETGSYTNSHQSGNKYHGKGPESRAQQSAKEKEVAYDDPAVDTDWQPAANEKEAFKDEARRIRNDGGVANPKNYNVRNSPGEKLLQEQEKTEQFLKKITGIK